MTKHKSFLPSDFSLSNIPVFFIAYVSFSLFCVLFGAMLDQIPLFWRGFLCGIGIGLSGALYLLLNSKKTDVSKLPELSSKTQKICSDPNCKFPSPTFLVAVKLYREETGVTLSEAIDKIKDYINVTS